MLTNCYADVEIYSAGLSPYRIQGYYYTCCIDENETPDVEQAQPKMNCKNPVKIYLSANNI